MKKLPFIYLILSMLGMFSEYTGEDYNVMVLYYAFFGINCIWAVVLVNRALQQLDN